MLWKTVEPERGIEKAEGESGCHLKTYPEKSPLGKVTFEKDIIETREPDMGLSERRHRRQRT